MNPLQENIEKRSNSSSEQVLFKDTVVAFLTNAIRCSRLWLWLGYFIYFKFTHVNSSIVYQWLRL